MRKFLALLVAAACLLATTAGFAEIGGPVYGGAHSSSSTYNYFTDAYEYLNDVDPVFQTQTYEDIKYLLNQTGTYVVLFGGASDEKTQASIPYINEVAKEVGIDTIYNFDFKLDGNTVDIADSGSPYANYYTDLISYLPQVNTIFANGETVTSDKAKSNAKKVVTSFLFVYNKGEGGIVSYVTTTATHTDYETAPEKADEYKEQLRTVLGPVAGTYGKIDNFAYIAGTFNAKRGSTEPLIFDQAVDGELVYQHVTYHELTKLLEADGNYVILIGGSWCPNTRAVVKYINESAHQYGINKVYLFDTKLDAGVPASGVYTDANLQIRETGHPLAYLYVDLVKQYLTNITTLYNVDTTFVEYTKGSETIKANKLQAPFLFTYNKDRRDSAWNKAPISGSVELMYTWANIQPGYQSGANYNTYRSSLSDLFARFEKYDATYVNKEKPWVSYVAATNGNNGKIVGLTTEQEYRLPTEQEWTAATASELTGLPAGTVYYVRYRERAGYNAAGETAIVTVYADGGITEDAPTDTVDNPALPDTGNLFEAITAEQYSDLLKSAGNYVLLQGDINSTDTLEEIRTVAVQYNISKIYVNPDLGQSKNSLFLYQKDRKDSKGRTAKQYGTIELPETIDEAFRYALDDTLGRYAAYHAFLTNKEAPVLRIQSPSSGDVADGKIFGITIDMEYRLPAVPEWIKATESEIAGLKNGDAYLFRYTAIDGFNTAGETAVITVAPDHEDEDNEVVNPNPGTNHPGSGSNNPPTDDDCGTGGTGGGGGGGGGTTASSKITITTDGDGTTTASLTVDTLKPLIATAVASEKSGKAANIEINIDADDKTKAIVVKLPKTALATIATTTSAGITIQSRVGTVTIDAKAVKSIEQNAQSDFVSVNFGIAKTLIQNRPTYDFSVTDEKGAVAYDGNADITVHYTLNNGEDKNAVVLYYIEAGKTTVLNGRYNPLTETVTIHANGAAAYAIGYNKVDFADIAKGEWYYDAVTFIASREITTGIDAIHFAPDEKLTRGQFLTLLLRTYGITPGNTTADNFADSGDDYYTPYLAYAKSHKIANGVGDNQFEPDSYITRQDLFTLLYKAVKELGTLPEAKTKLTLETFRDAKSLDDYAVDAAQALIEAGIVTGDGNQLNGNAQSTRAEFAQIIYNLLNKVNT